MSIDNPLNSPEMRAMKAGLALEQLKALGLDLDDLVALRTSGELPGQTTFRDYLPVARKAAKSGSRHVYSSYWSLLDVGLPEMCACMCPACVAISGRTDTDGHPIACPCRAAAACTCPKDGFADGPDVTSCTDTYHGLGDKVLGLIVATDIELAMAWAKARAKKRWARTACRFTGIARGGPTYSTSTPS